MYKFVVWFYIRTVIRLTRIIWLCRVKNKIRILLLIFKEGFRHVCRGQSVYCQTFFLYVVYDSRSRFGLFFSDETSTLI